jgi:hypothetical protein
MPEGVRFFCHYSLNFRLLFEISKLIVLKSKLMFEKTADDKELENQIELNKPSLLKTFEDNFNVQEETLKVIIRTKKHADLNKFESNKLLWNVAGYVNISSYDLKIIGNELTFAKREWSKRYFARQACLLIYESLNDLLELLGKNFRNKIGKLSDSTELANSLNELTKRLNQFKKNYGDRLYLIRNVSIAHRDQDIFEQIKIIESIKWTEVTNYVFTFDKIMNDLGKFLQVVINKSSGELDR